MELGVSEEYANKLATDRNMTDIKNMSHDDVASTLGISKDAEEFITTMQIIAEQGSRRRAAKKSTKITIRAKAVDDMDRPEITSRFNALNHELVPHQELVGPANVSPEEQLAIETEELAPWPCQKGHCCRAAVTDISCIVNAMLLVKEFRMKMFQIL